MEKVNFNDHADPVSILKAMIAVTTSESDYADGYRDGLRYAISILTIADTTESDTSTAKLHRDCGEFKARAVKGSPLMY